MRILVCGPRRMNSADADHYVSAALRILGYYGEHVPTMVIQGGATGVDAAAKRWAGFRGCPFEEYKADWNQHGLAAGPIRNKRMLDEAYPDLVLAIQPCGRTTPGTQNMIKQARSANVPVFCYVV